MLPRNTAVKLQHQSGTFIHVKSAWFQLMAASDLRPEPRVDGWPDQEMQAVNYWVDMWTARTVSSCTSQAKCNTPETRQLRWNMKGACAHHRLSLKWVSTSSGQVQDHKCPEPVFRFQASSSWEHRCSIWQTWRQQTQLHLIGYRRMGGFVPGF